MTITDITAIAQQLRDKKSMSTEIVAQQLQQAFLKAYYDEIDELTKTVPSDMEVSVERDMCKAVARKAFGLGDDLHQPIQKD